MLIGQVLERAKIDKTEVEILLAHLLGKDRSFVKAFPELRLGRRQITKLKQFIKRRLNHEPLAYILGHKEFCGLSFKVDKKVMIPRPETESLVMEVVKHVYAKPHRASSNFGDSKPLSIVDVGTGCGNIAISLAKAIPFAKVYAVEKDLAACKVAKENIRNHKVGGQVKLIQGDLLQPIKESVDIIVANLPYIPRSRFPALAPEIRDWEPRIALDGGSDGLELYRKLFQQAPEVLKPSGLLLYELDGQTHTLNFK